MNGAPSTLKWEDFEENMVPSLLGKVEQCPQPAKGYNATAMVAIKIKKWGGEYVYTLYR